MSLRIIAVHNIDGTMPTGDQDSRSGLTYAARAYLDHGIAREFATRGVEIESIMHPALSESEMSDDRMERLGRFNARIAKQVAGARKAGVMPLLMGGTCSHLIGMIAGLQRADGAGAKIGLIWLDAHGDFNTPYTSLSGMLGGMPVAVAAGLCWPVWREQAGQLAPLPTDRIVMVDVRNLDAAEEELISATDVEIARFGDQFAVAPILTAIDRLAEQCDLLYLHVDADILDATLQPNHPTAEPDGPELAPVLAVMRHAFATGKVAAFGVVSVNPQGESGEISRIHGTALLVEGVTAWRTSPPLTV